MAIYSKGTQILGLALILFASAAAFGQDYWSEQKAMSCHPKLLSSVHGGVFQPQVKQYEWQGRVTNAYDQTVTFSMYMKVGNQKKTIGRFTVEPGKSTNATSLYYDDSSKLLEISVDNVCFLKGGCKVSCYAGCDNGRSINQPSCGDQPNNPTPNQIQNPTNYPGATNSAEVIKQRIKQNLVENFRLGSGNSNSQVSLDSNGVTIAWDSMTTIGTIRTTYRLTFDKLATAEPVNGQYPQLHFPPGSCVAKFVSNGSAAGCSDVPYSLGNNGQNFNELKALVAQLTGAPSSTQPTASNAEAIRQKIVENLRANMRDMTVISGIGRHVYSAFVIEPSPSGLLIRYRDTWSQTGSNLQSVWDYEDKISFENLAANLEYNSMYKNLITDGDCWFNVTQSPYPVSTVRQKTIGCGPQYDAGPGNQNFNELKALVAQLAGGTAPTQNSSNGTNNSSGNSSTQTNSGSSSSGGKTEEREVLPKAAYDNVMAGDEQYNAKNYAAALESYKRAAEIAPNSPTVNLYLGDAYVMTGKYAEAVDAFQKAIENRPTLVEAYKALVSSLDRLNRKDEAIEWLKKGVRAVPKDVSLWKDLGIRMRSSPKERGGAGPILQHTVELDPKCGPCHYRLGNVFGELEQWDAAIRSYETAASLIYPNDDGHGSPYQGLMGAYIKVGKFAEVVATYQKMLALPAKGYITDHSFIDDWPVLYNLGLAYCGLKDKTKAMATYLKIRGPDPRVSNMYSTQLMEKIQSTWPAGPKKPRK